MYKKCIFRNNPNCEMTEKYKVTRTVPSSEEKLKNLLIIIMKKSLISQEKYGITFFLQMIS